MEALKETVNVYAPATGELILQYRETPASAAGEMMNLSKDAFGAWSQLDIDERLRYLKQLRLTIVQRLDEVAELISKDTGKVKTDALVADIMPTLDAIMHIEKHAKKALKSQKVSTPFLLIGHKSSVHYMPRGSVLVISPWNYPFLLAMVPLVSALASGNTVILKPSEVTPAVGKMIEELFKEAGFPKNVVQIAHGGRELGASLTKQKPDYIFFTGSVGTGRIIQEIAARDLIPTTLELGGKDPMLVFSDADYKRAAQGAVWGAFTNSGQVCMSVERLIIQREALDPFLQELLPIVNQLEQGNGKESDIGSMTSIQQISIVREHVEDALEKGAILLAGDPPSEWDDQSMYIKPMVLTNVSEDMLIMQEETFGPVLPILTVNTEEEAIQVANNSRYGLNASVWTTNKEKGRYAAHKLLSGAVLINDVLITVANNNLPFGGVKESGIGRYHGDQGIRIFCHEKAVMEDMGLKKTEIQWYPYKGKYEHFTNLLTAYFGKRKSMVKVFIEYLKLIKLSK